MEDKSIFREASALADKIDRYVFNYEPLTHFRKEEYFGFGYDVTVMALLGDRCQDYVDMLEQYMYVAAKYGDLDEAQEAKELIKEIKEFRKRYFKLCHNLFDCTPKTYLQKGLFH